MRIGFINLVRRGGMAHYHSQLAVALAKEVTVEAIISDVVDPALYAAVPCRRINIGKNGRDTLLFLLNPIVWWRLGRFFSSLDYDLLHVTSSHLQNIYILLFCRIPIAYTIHDIQPHEGERWYTRLMETWMRRRARLLFVHNAEAKEILQQVGYKAKVAEVSHGDYAFFTRWADPAIQPQDQLLFFGRVEPYKGLTTLLQAMPLVWREHQDWRLVIAGHGDLASYQELLTDERIEVHNRFIEDEEVAGFFQRCRLVVLPYSSATQSGVIPIASAFAKPSIATAVGNMAETIKNGETGWLVEPNDPAALAAAINKAIAEVDVLPAIGQKARQRMEVAMDWQPIAQKHVAAYAELLEI